MGRFALIVALLIAIHIGLNVGRVCVSELRRLPDRELDRRMLQQAMEENSPLLPAGIVRAPDAATWLADNPDCCGPAGIVPGEPAKQFFWFLRGVFVSPEVPRLLILSSYPRDGGTAVVWFGAWSDACGRLIDR